MKSLTKQTLAIALLAGSTLSAFAVAPAMAQTQSQGAQSQGTQSQGGASQTQPIIPRQGGAEGAGSMNGGASGQMKQQDMGSSTQQKGSAGADGSTTAQGQDTQGQGGQRLKPQGDQAQQPMQSGKQNAESTDPKKPRAQDSAQQKQDGQTDKSTAQSGSDATKPANADTARQNNTGTQSEGKNQASTDRPSNEVTGSINISTEQRTQVREVFVRNKVAPAKINVEVNVGIAVPRTVELHPLPPRIIEIVPAYRGYEYFVLADGRIIIVQPATHEVVYILAG
ncbi:DUF1236 domain-containing protein [Rhizobium sp. XQZ8]|uniref:DUF1236 domain-containing protein n=1 Tax=Rhizobium populisoli TaxID=2859785 RepID=UPI001C670ACE|nr:DUF1236 domain-containing protein [Rhizobium populisoli]MBW6425903.1 DUF1236 domain-containing protein [Rhizobium populisoli]